MAAVWVRFRVELRTRWRAWLGLAVLVGIAGGAVMALAAGARRTDSAYSRFLRAQRAYDVAILISTPDAGPLARFDPDEIARLPQVSDVATGRFFFTYFKDGAPALADADGQMGTQINRLKIIEGRAANPDRADEVVVSFQLADTIGLEVGDRVRFADPKALEPPPEEGPVGQAYAAVNRQILDVLPDGKATVVGMEAAPGEFPPLGAFTPLVHLTPAFDRRVGSTPESVFIEQQVVFVRLERGAADLPAFQRGLEGLSDGRPFQQIVQRDQAANVQRDFHRQAIALWLLAGLTALTTMLILGQLVARSAIVEASENPALAALGMTRVQRFAVGILRATAVAIVATGVAIGLALVASPQLPLGLAHTAEPDPGFAADAFVLALGAGVTVLLFVGVSAWPTWRTARAGAGTTGVGDVRARPSRVAGALAGLGAPTSVVAGMRLAFERGRGAVAVPVRSTIACLTVGVAALIAALTFGASLTHFLDTPALYGVVWDSQVTSFEEGVDLPRDAPRVLRDHGVEGVAFGYNALPLRAGGVAFDAFALDPIYGDALPPLIAGRNALRADEIVLGTRTLDKLGVGVGDPIAVRLQGGPRVALRVVGRAVIPPVSDVGRLGEGAVLSLGGARRLFSGLDEVDAPSLYLRLAEGSREREVVAALQRELDLDPDSLDSSGGGPEEPTDLVSFGRVERLPFVLAAVLGLFAVGALAHLLVTAVRRRRRELALLKALGFTRHQVSAAVACQSSALVCIALLIGLPLGIAAGRTAWTLFARDLGVIAVSTVPVAAVVLISLAAIVLANLIAAGPAAAAGRIRPAVALRTE